MLSTVEVAVSKPAAQSWSHLPNASLIDRVLEDVRARPDAWDVLDAVSAASRRAAWDSAWDAARAAGGVAWDEVWRTVWTWSPAARDPILALIAWPDSAYLLDTDPEQVRLLGLLDHQPSVLLYPASLALHNHKEAV